MIIMCITVAAANESRCSRRRDVYIYNTTVELNDYTLTYYNVFKSRPSGKNHVRYRFSGYYDLRPRRRSVQHPAGRYRNAQWSVIIIITIMIIVVVAVLYYYARLKPPAATGYNRLTDMPRTPARCRYVTFTRYMRVI